jgi:hypothetical protein
MQFDFRDLGDLSHIGPNSNYNPISNTNCKIQFFFYLNMLELSQKVAQIQLLN